MCLPQTEGETKPLNFSQVTGRVFTVSRRSCCRGRYSTHDAVLLRLCRCSTWQRTVAAS